MFLRIKRFVLAGSLAMTALAGSYPVHAGEKMTPLPPAGKLAPSLSCTVQYSRAADAYWPVIGDIIRFNAMFENYAALCSKADPIQYLAVRPLAKKLQTLAEQDVTSSYEVIERIIRKRLPPLVAKDCRTDQNAQNEAVRGFHNAMDDQAMRAEKRLARSVKMEKDSSARICHNLTGLRKDLEKRLKGRTIENPLFEIASLRRAAAGPMSVGPANAYKVYRETLVEMRKARAAAEARKKKG